MPPIEEDYWSFCANQQPQYVETDSRDPLS